MYTAVSTKIESFFANYPLKRYAKGQIIIYAGDGEGTVFHLVSGKVKQYDISNRGEEVILNVFKSPAFFPLSIAINHTPNPYFYEAESPIELRAAPARETITFIKHNPDVMYDLLSRVYKGIDGLLGRMTHLMTSSAHDRLLYELILEAKRFGKTHKDSSYTIKLNEKELASRTGLARETINREIHKLKRSKMLEIRLTDIRIPSLDRLEEILAEDSRIN